MPIGSAAYGLHQGKLVQAMVRLLGTGDFHTHLRVAPLKRVFRRLAFAQRVPRLLEVGCGSGLNLFELSTLAPIRATGIDVDERAIARADEARQRLGYDHLLFYCADAQTYIPTSPFDCLLLMDLLEHVPDPAGIVSRLGRYLTEGGYVIVSVPTPQYPRVFGRRFHEEIGHLVDGYTLEDLEHIVPESFTLVTYQYHTGLLTWPACFLYYRYIRRIQCRSVRLALGTLLIPFRWVDLVRTRRTSTSLFAVYQLISTDS